MGSLRSVYVYLEEKSWLDSTELIVVTADADDGTPKMVAREIIRFPHHQHVLPGKKVGKGRDVKAGFILARGQKVLFMDADLATPLHHIAPAFKRLGGTVGMVIGVRDLAKMHNTLKRRFSSQLSNLGIRLLARANIKDTQCGFKCLSREMVDLVGRVSVIDRWGFDIELIRIAKDNAVGIDEIAIDDWHDPKEVGLTGESQLRAMTSTLKEAVRVSIRSLAGKYRRLK